MSGIWYWSQGFRERVKRWWALRFVHQTYKDAEEANAVILSGNGPLVQVLQYALKSRAFVQPIRNFFHSTRGKKPVRPTRTPHRL